MVCVRKMACEVELKTVDAGVLFSSEAGNPDTAARFNADIEMFTSGGESPDPTNLSCKLDERPSRPKTE
jgi:peptide/nickel transport system substrate-binding protein